MTERLGPQHKSIPSSAWGATVEEFLAGEPRLSSISTPVLTLDQRRLDHNIDAMARWVAERGILLAPHGKTTMAPQLWQRQLDAGAWAITLATGWQVQLARRFGVKRILMANPMVAAADLQWLAAELAADPHFEFYCWADSAATVEHMTRHLDGLDASARPINVLVELGAPGGRTGARGHDEAMRVARAIIASPHLALAGVGGYEGALGHDRHQDAVRNVNDYLAGLVDLYRQVVPLAEAEPLLTAGGSAYPDLVAERTAELVAGGGRVVLRSGAYITHDDGFYAGISPFSDDVDAANPVHLAAAIHGWARVTSTPEPGLALLDAGKRDLPYDEGLPVVQTPETARAEATVTAMNDQHTFVRGADLNVGDVVRLGLSHPCTAFDKWRLIPVVSDVDERDPIVVDLIHTYF
jgi:D-serine deaminase-like pyridoxal phosphate-dependent protein